MEKWKSEIVLFFLSIVCAFNCNAAFCDMHFKYLTIENGLTSNSVTCVFRDSKDYLWIGTNNGLNCYDGDKMKIYQHHMDDSTSISNNYIICIFEDHEGKLWFGTNNGLNVFDRKTEIFHHFYPNHNKPNSISNDCIRTIIEDKNKTLWIATLFGLNKYMPKTNDFKQYHLPEHGDNEKDNYLVGLSYDSDNTFWLGNKSDALWSFNIQKESFSKYANPIIASACNIEKRLVFINNQVWIGTVGKGLICYDIRSGQFSKIPIAKNGFGTSGEDISYLAIDKNKNLLIGVDQGGINRLDLQTLKMEYCFKDERKEKGLNNNGIWTLYLDVEGILYVGTSAGGLNIYNKKEDLTIRYQHNPFNNNSLTYNVVHRIFEDSKGLIWFCTDGGGLSIFDPITKIFKNFIHNPNDPTSISGNAILCIAEDKNHDVWIGTWGKGLNKFNRKTERFSHYMVNEADQSSISSNNVWDLVFDDMNHLWIAYLLDSGVDIFDINHGVIKRYRNLPNDSTSISSNKINGLKKFGENIWLFTNRGYCIWKETSKTFKRPKTLQNVFINDVSQDKEGCYWISTKEDGLFILNKGGSLENFNQRTEFKCNQITGTIEDPNGNIWICSEEGLSKYEKLNKRFTKNYLSVIDHNNRFPIISSLQSTDGLLYLGGYNGVYVVNPHMENKNTYIPKVRINEFLLYNKPISISSPNSPLNRVIEETTEIELDYKNAVFSFGFNAINYTEPKKALYAYKLDGYDEDWTYTTDERKFASYTKPDPGTYSFMVKASNNDGVWNENPQTIRIIIRPPLWQKWWFRITLAILTLGSILSFYFWRIFNLKEQHKVLEKAVWDRTTELRQVNSELGKSKEEVMIKNMAIEKQNIELEIANQTKNKLFSIVAHDLKNPFNTILGFINILIDDYDDLSDAERRDFLSIIQVSSQTAYDLIENLLNWARTQTNKITIHFQEINVLEMINSNVQLLKATSELKSISLVFDQIIESHNILADKNMIDTVIRNLLSNAIKFSNKGTKIEISSIKRDDFIEINIRDKGVGMTSEQIEKLFMIDENRSTQGTSGEKGTGLGIIICKEFVERNHGEINVSSLVGEGTTFVVSLPSLKKI